MYGESISDIRISLTQYMGKVQMYVKQGSMPTVTDFDYASVDGDDIIMRTSDRNFQPVGMKYILLIPLDRFGTNFNIVRYSLEYTTRRSISQITKDVPVFGSCKYGHTNAYKYVAIEKGQDLTISLTDLSGDPNLLVSIDPRNPNPTIENNTYHSRKEGMDSITIKGSDLFTTNPSCNPSAQTLLGGSPCEIYIGIY